VLEDGHGNEYTTFREGLGEAAEALAGRRAVITYHEEERGQYRNVYLDSVTPSQPRPRRPRRLAKPTRRMRSDGERGSRLALPARPLRA
jgi:hypothetical protein